MVVRLSHDVDWATLRSVKVTDNRGESAQSSNDPHCFPRLGTVPVIGTGLVEGTDRRIHAVPVSCGNDGPHAGRGASVVLTSHGPHARGPLLCDGTRMDHQRDSGWIEPLEATTLSDDEEAESEYQTLLHFENNIIQTKRDHLFAIRRRDRGRTIMGGRGGCRTTPP